MLFACSPLLKLYCYIVFGGQLLMLTFFRITCDDEEERASRRVYRGCTRSPTCKGCTSCVCFGCDICRFSDCSCQTCADFTNNAKAWLPSYHILCHFLTSHHVAYLCPLTMFLISLSLHMFVYNISYDEKKMLKSGKSTTDLIWNRWWHGHNNIVPDQLRVLDNYCLVDYVRFF